MINRIGGSSWCSGNWLAIVSGRVILENHLSALCLLISVGLVPEITTYFLGRGPAGGRQPSAYGMRLWTAYRVSSGASLIAMLFLFVSLHFRKCTIVSSAFLIFVFLQQFSTLRRVHLLWRKSTRFIVNNYYYTDWLICLNLLSIIRFLGSSILGITF